MDTTTATILLSCLIVLTAAIVVLSILENEQSDRTIKLLERILSEISGEMKEYNTPINTNNLEEP